jgi:hypothetical protein
MKREKTFNAIVGSGIVRIFTGELIKEGRLIL